MVAKAPAPRSVLTSTLESHARSTPHPVTDRLCALKETAFQDPDIRRLIYHIPTTHFPKVIDHLAREHQWALIQEVFTYWGAIDPEAALKKLLSIGEPLDLHTTTYVSIHQSFVRPFFSRASAARTITKAWLARDSDNALKTLLEIPDDSLKRAIQHLIIEHLIAEDPAKAFQVAIEKMDLRGGYSASGFSTTGDTSEVRKIFEAWAEKDPPEAVAQAQELADTELRKSAVNAIAQQWARRDPEAAETWASTLPHDLQSSVLLSLKGPMTKRDPERVLALAEFNESDGPVRSHRDTPWGIEKVRHSKEGSIYAQWLEDDPNAALTWREALTDIPRQRNIAAATVRHFIEADPMKAASFALDAPPAAQQAALEELANAWSLRDRQAALDWAQHISDPVLQRHYLYTLYERDIEHSASQFAGAFESTVVPELQNVVADQLIRRWTSQNPQAAADWLATQDFGTHMAAHFGTVAQRWARKAPHETIHWVTAIERQAVQQGAIQGLAQTLHEDMGETAHDWVRNQAQVDPSLRMAIFDHLNSLARSP